MARVVEREGDYLVGSLLGGAIAEPIGNGDGVIISIVKTEDQHGDLLRFRIHISTAPQVTLRIGNGERPRDEPSFGRIENLTRLSAGSLLTLSHNLLMNGVGPEVCADGNDFADIRLGRTRGRSEGKQNK